MNESVDPTRLSRRTVLKWFATAAVAMNVPGFPAFAATAAPVTGYGTDPTVAGYYDPGAFWPLTLTPAQKKTVTALADVILPADKYGPAASAVRVPDFIDEWVSAPYDRQQGDAKVIVPGLDWLEAESAKRFQKDFASLSLDQQKAICDDICWTKKAKKEFKDGARFFDRFRDVAAGAYYGTPEGWEAIGYVGNVAMATFDGPPPEVLEKLGVTQTVA